MKIKRCPGMEDLLPQKMEKFRAVEKVFRELCLSWGYQEIRTPIIEPLYLFTASGTLTPQMLSRLYSFVDWNGWSGERVVLRPESTIPVARLFLENFPQESLARFFYIQNIFFFQAEKRERWQAGVEFIGGQSPYADAELIFLGWEILNKLNIKAELKLSHVGLVKALLKEFGSREEDLERALGGELSAFGNLSPNQENSLKLLFQLKGKGKEFIGNLSPLLPRSAQVEKEVKDFWGLLELLEGLPYVVDMELGRGFEYYTGVVFHFYSRGKRLGGGGRYDDLLSLLGERRHPASGFAFFMDELLELVPEVEPRKAIGVLAPSFKEALELCSELHKPGIVASPGPGEIRIEKTEQGLKLVCGSLCIEVSSLAELLSLPEAEPVILRCRGWGSNPHGTSPNGF